jgi:lysozyme
MKTFGVDVSHWESKINWQLAAPALGFAYYKCTEGTRWFDVQFDNNRKGCDQAGLPHAPYHYFHPLIDPVQQAEFFIGIAGLSYKRYILDAEKPDYVVDIVSRIRAFLDRCEELTGIKPAIYTSAGYWNEFVKPKPAWASSYDLLVANYTTQRIPIIPIGWITYKIWQFSSYFFIPGCTEACDGNWFNGTQDQCRSGLEL